ncbi:MAG: AMP-binding protein [Deltaproteobacteria bacterium]|nr:AMP-binding protein [Deltaproteobacteria bacterium]
MQRQFVPKAVLETMQNEKITAAMMVPTMINFLLNVPEMEKFDLSSLQWVMVGGAPMSPANAKRMTKQLGCPICLRLWPHRNLPAFDCRQSQRHVKRSFRR